MMSLLCIQEYTAGVRQYHIRAVNGVVERFSLTYVGRQLKVVNHVYGYVENVKKSI